jgi:hypothetical protein
MSAYTRRSTQTLRLLRWAGIALAAILLVMLGLIIGLFLFILGTVFF